MPVYNTEKYIEKSIISLINQTLGFLENIQLIMINDGSKDDSEKICLKYKELYPENIIYISQDNFGVSVARNNGIRKAEGKYICFLDSDDMFTEDLLLNVTNFFDNNYDSIDLVTYMIVPIINGNEGNLHYRYNYLTETKIYDLTDRENIYISLTTVNYCVKNYKTKNILFDESLAYHEDQKYCIDVIKRKMKIGYCNEGKYLYFQQPNSITQTYFHAYFLFNKTTQYWENLFNSYNNKKIPGYTQALFLNDIAWKMKLDILKPYQYEGDKFIEKFDRILNLLNKTDDDVIINHPGIGEYYKYYYINLKKEKNIKLIYGKNTSNLAIKNYDSLIYSTNFIDLNILKMKITKKTVKILGYIISPFFLFSDVPELYLYTSELRKKQKINIRKSSYNYLEGKEEFIKTYLFSLELELENITRLEFIVKINTAIMKTRLIFENKTIFNDQLKRYLFYQDGREYKVEENIILIQNAIKKDIVKYKKQTEYSYFINDKKRWIIRLLARLYYKKNHNIWLYYDCEGVLKDNGYYQYIHDIDKKDKIDRYFISCHSNTEIKSLFTKKQRKKVIKFNSLKHKLLYLHANKVITAYIEQKNCSPYTKGSFINYIDVSKNPDIIYLQHGVLHAHMPWKFSYDRLLIDKEVISTNFEKENLINNYCFEEDNLIDSGMPRYDFISQETKPKNVILFAPSWRNYLVKEDKEGWISTEEKFIESSFYKQTSEFLNSIELKNVLEKYDYILDFKLHPIFKRYEHLYEKSNNRIIFGNGKYKNDEYKIFITDYSSFVFDFVYLKRAIIYFFPDYDLFKAGLNLYRQLDLPFENGFGEFCETADELLIKIVSILENDGNDIEKYTSRTNGFFIHNDNNQRERVYEALIKESNN